jgi:3-oxoacyl-[acyl-carrier-protein] synthase II
LRHAIARLTSYVFLNDELLEYFRYIPCASPGLPPTIASLSRPTAACAASVRAIGDAARLIRAGEADVAVCGGSEACIDVVSLGGFAAARALSTSFNETPARASRPFDRDRDGFVMGEGAGILVIEELEHAIRRGAKPLAEIVGCGRTADAYHITSGPEDGDGARRAMQGALRQASLKPGDIQHLNAHSTSTPSGDVSELEAIKAVFGREGKIAVSATKSATGHLLGAAGGAEAIFTIHALRDQVAPPTLNLDNADTAAEGVDIVAREARRMPMEHAISNGFGFGDVNASIIFRRWQ